MDITDFNALIGKVSRGIQVVLQVAKNANNGQARAYVVLQNCSRAKQLSSPKLAD